MPKFNLNFPGSEKVDLFFINRMAAAGKTPSYARYGCSMTGWFTEPDCVNRVEPDLTSDNVYFAGWRAWTEEDLAEYKDTVKRLERVKYLMARAAAFEWNSFVPFFRHAIKLVFDLESSSQPYDEIFMQELAAAEAAAEQLKYLCDPEEISWYIWGDEMPGMAKSANFDYFQCFDYEGFRPFLVPYMLKEQRCVKGNIIVIAGGGFAQRWNQSEGYCIARAFNRMGYNAFVLQRRVKPWAREDACLDLQRSIRYLKYNAEKLGINAIEHIATVGFSGGGGTIIGAVENYYGDVLPTVVYPDYTPDEIDQVNADYEVAMPIYGGLAPGETENKNLPSFFAVVGGADELMLNARGSNGQRGEITFFNLLRSKPGIDLELHVFAAAGHGFGTARGVEEGLHDSPGIIGADRWMQLADDFMMVRFGLIDRTYPFTQRPNTTV